MHSPKNDDEALSKAIALKNAIATHPFILLQ